MSQNNNITCYALFVLRTNTISQNIEQQFSLLDEKILTSLMELYICTSENIISTSSHEKKITCLLLFGTLSGIFMHKTICKINKFDCYKMFQ